MASIEIRRALQFERDLRAFQQDFWMSSTYDEALAREVRALEAQGNRLGARAMLLWGLWVLLPALALLCLPRTVSEWLHGSDVRQVVFAAFGALVGKIVSVRASLRYMTPRWERLETRLAALRTTWATRSTSPSQDLALN